MSDNSKNQNNDTPSEPKNQLPQDNTNTPDFEVEAPAFVLIKHTKESWTVKYCIKLQKGECNHEC